MLLDQQQAPPAAQQAAPTAQHPSTAETSSPGTAAWAVVAASPNRATAALMIVFMSISSVVQIEFSVWPRGRGGGSSGRTSRGTRIAGSAARAASGLISDLTGTTSTAGASTQQVTHADNGMPLSLSGQHVASLVQAIVPGIGIARAIAALPKASDASASSMRIRALMTGNTGVRGR
jgi:hypothetical protein